MRYLELLSPARNPEIGIAAIDCGADAVYIAGPDFGARKDAGNSFEGIAGLCAYAHRFGARVFVTCNISVRDDELGELHRQMLMAQEAGADAFIVRDERIFGMQDITVPLHASTQCAIRDVERAKHFEALGSARIVLERELPLTTVREICGAVNCEVEFFVHGALCVCYSGECRLSEHIDGRSADRGECIQACRSLYDLEDGSGKVLARNRALLSLRDYNLKNRLEELADAGVMSFKIEGRLKNASYVKNVVRAYSKELDAIVARNPEKYRRASFGKVSGGFEPDLEKTFNRGYTELFLDGKRGRWSSMNAPKSMGEKIGTIIALEPAGRGSVEIAVRLRKKDTKLVNGDGFAFTAPNGKVVGFRGDSCSGNLIRAKATPGLKCGTVLFRNLSAEFEKRIESMSPRREIPVALEVEISKAAANDTEIKTGIKEVYVVEACARSGDGREVRRAFRPGAASATDRERAAAMLREQLSKRSGIYSFSLGKLAVNSPDGSMPFLSASAINSMRRTLAEDLDAMPCGFVPIARGGRTDMSGAEACAAPQHSQEPLMLSKYCIRYELGMCPRHHHSGGNGPLYLINNGRRLTLRFDCARCEMSVSEK